MSVLLPGLIYLGKLAWCVLAAILLRVIPATFYSLNSQRNLLNRYSLACWMMIPTTVVDHLWNVGLMPMLSAALAVSLAFYHIDHRSEIDATGHICGR